MADFHPDALEIPNTGAVHRCDVLIVGAGAAGLNAAVRMHARGIEDIIVITESLEAGTSINTGSDKQTYYKIGMSGAAGDSPRAMADQYTAGGSMHGDLALVEAAGSGRAFLHLADLGVAFPTDRCGQFIGYRTDHDAVGRGSSVGPYTSRDMCRCLIADSRRRGIRIDEGVHAARLVTLPSGNRTRVVGVMAMDDRGGLVGYRGNHVVFAVGGPGGLYAASVYPPVHLGSIGLALEAGALARGLPECQYGLASTKFRWNVSGTYMQVVPRFVSTDAEGREEPKEFLRESVPDAARMHSLVFLKGYQWPFDAAKLPRGSSLIDILVYRETVEKGRRVYLDFRENPEDFRIDALDPEAREYLEKSGADQPTPYERLARMNPGAISLYADHNIDIGRELLEIAVCAQHNNGGLAGDVWWRSENLAGLYPVGEVNGSHGVSRPGGSALNAGQVGGFRIAEIIDRGPALPSPDDSAVGEAFRLAAEDLKDYLVRGMSVDRGWKSVRGEIQERMTRYGAHIRSADDLAFAVTRARELWNALSPAGTAVHSPREAVQVLRNRHLCLSHLVYLEAMLFQVESGVGSRGASIVLDPSGRALHPDWDTADWSVARENPSYRTSVLLSSWNGQSVENRWEPCRGVPETDEWFETAWADFRSGTVYQPMAGPGSSRG